MRLWILAVMLLVVSPAMAQKQTAQFGNWTVECVPPSSGGVTNCTIGLELAQRGARSFLGSFRIVPAADGGGLSIWAGGPFGYASAKTEKDNLFVCPNQPICISTSEEAKRFVLSLKSANIITVKVRTDSGSYEFEAPLSGYRQAVAQIISWGYGTAQTPAKKP